MCLTGHGLDIPVVGDVNLLHRSFNSSQTKSQDWNREGICYLHTGSQRVNVDFYSLQRERERDNSLHILRHTCGMAAASWNHCPAWFHSEIWFPLVKLAGLCRCREHFCHSLVWNIFWYWFYQSNLSVCSTHWLFFENVYSLGAKILRYMQQQDQQILEKKKLLWRSSYQESIRENVLQLLIWCNLSVLCIYVSI